MKVYQTSEIKNIALIGSAGSGKTTLAESMLYEAGIIKRRGSVEAKNTVSDYFPVEQEYGYSVFSTVFHVEWNNKKLNIIDGRPLLRLPRQERARVISVVLTGRPQVGSLTAQEVVALGRSPYTGFFGRLREADRRVVREALDDMGVAPLARRNVATLSDGEMQKVMIAKSLAQQTPVILLDEPTAFLDFPGKIDLMLLLQRLAHEERKTILLSTHDLETALQTADRLWLLADGALHDGTPHELADQGFIDMVQVECRKAECGRRKISDMQRR